MIVPPLKGLKICFNTPNPGLAPWAMREYRPVGAHCPNATIKSPPQYDKQYNQTKNTTERNNPFKSQKHLTNTIPRHNSANVQYDKEPCKGDTPA